MEEESRTSLRAAAVEGEEMRWSELSKKLYGEAGSVNGGRKWEKVPGAALFVGDGELLLLREEEGRAGRVKMAVAFFFFLKNPGVGYLLRGRRRGCCAWSQRWRGDRCAIERRRREGELWGRWNLQENVPKERVQAYASMSTIVHIVDLASATRESHANVTEIHDGLDFSAVGDEDAFGIFSVNFSSDGRELVAGSSYDSIHIYDLEANRLKSNFEAHKYDVNTVTFADETSNIIYSGSDDSICKIWDRRCSTADGKAAGALSGHIEGITFIDSRGDGRYFISNGKDQTTKLWDVRKMSSKPEYFKRKGPHWDYRYMAYPTKAKNLKHPRDQSIATYRGHSVLCTLIRCHFSPAHNTGQKYIYTGSHDGCVYIYEVTTGAQVAKLNLCGATVRDCSWHPYYPILVCSSWDCIVARWEFPGTYARPIFVNKRRRGRYIE